MTPISVPGELGREARQEVVERLFARQARDRRQDPERIGREQDDRPRVAGALRGKRVRDQLELVGGARVLGLRRVVEIESTELVDGDVLEHGPEGVRCLPDLRLGVPRETNRLRVAAALDVEHAAPPQPCSSSPISRRSGSAESVVLPVPERPKKTATSPSSPTLAEQCIGNTPSSGSRSFITVKIDFLISPRVVRPADQHLGARRMQHDERLRPGAVEPRVGLHIGRVQDERLRLELLALSFVEVDEHRLREQRVIRVSRHDPHADAMRVVGACPGVDDVQRRRVTEVARHLLAETVEVLLGQLAVDLAPPDPILGGRLADDELVLRRTSRVPTGVDDERATLAEPPVAARAARASRAATSSGSGRSGRSRRSRDRTDPRGLAARSSSWPRAYGTPRSASHHRGGREHARRRP